MLGIIYHSHTRSDPYPSQTDINLAFYPDALYVIVGTATSASRWCALCRPSATARSTKSRRGSIG